MKIVKISIHGQKSGNLTTIEGAEFSVTANSDKPATKQLGAGLNLLLSMVAGYGLTSLRFVLEGNGKKQIVTASSNLKDATRNVLLNLVGLVHNAENFDRTKQIESPLLVDIASSFGLKGIKSVSVMEYQTAITHRFKILSKAEKIQKVKVLTTVTTPQDVAVSETYKAMFPPKQKTLPVSSTEVKPAKKQRNRKPAKQVETETATA